ncbi:hypothetical protein ABBQ38_000172 [Trebouxia sp. C0009 RCD-2024]
MLDIDTDPLKGLQTIIHGDFKAANIFFSPSAEAASAASETSAGSMAASLSACDFQWSGGGLAVTDVMYLLWTSVSPSVIRDREDDLLRCYHHLLQHELKQRQQLQHQKHDVPAYSYDQFCRHHQLAYLDYVRFLIGAMWGAVTPESCNELAQDINQGIHKRCAEHLAHMVDKADGLLSKFEEGWLEKRQPRTFAIS